MNRGALLAHNPGQRLELPTTEIHNINDCTTAVHHRAVVGDRCQTPVSSPEY